MFSMGMRPNVTDNSPGRGYRFFTGETVFQFGQGLSYTTFLYSWIEATRISRETIIADTQQYGIYPSRAPVRGVASVLVTNNGTRAGDVSVLLFVEPMNPGQGLSLLSLHKSLTSLLRTDGNPLQYLADFERIFLEPGQSQVVNFDLTAFTFAVVDRDGKYQTPSGTWTMRVEDQRFPIQL